MLTLALFFKPCDGSLRQCSQPFVFKRLWREVSQRRCEFTRHFWLREFSHWPHVRSNRKKNICASRQPAQRLALHSQPEMLAGVVRCKWRGHSCPRRRDRLKKFWRVV